MTRPIIYHNLDKSDYSFETDHFIFYFSSLYYRDNFRNKFMQNREDLKYKLSSRYNIEMEMVDYYDFILYSTLEIRGFRVYDKRGLRDIKCLSEIMCVGMIQIPKR